MLARPTLALAALLLVAAFPVPVAPLAAASGGSTPGFEHFYFDGPSPTVFPDELPFLLLAGEPSIGVNWNTGATFFQHGFETYRVAFDDNALTSTWTDVTPPNSEFNIDPLLYTDSQTGRTFAGGLDGTCSIMSFTDDDGESWTPMGNACVATLDHQSIVSGPWRLSAGAPATVAPSDRAVYYCAQANFVSCMVSYDGGLTFAAPAQVSCGFINPGFHGSLHIAPSGNVFLPFRNCGGQIGVAVSTNNGIGWTARPIPNTLTPDHGGFDPDVATTPNGHVYIAFANASGAAMVAKTTNNGTSWTGLTDVGASLGIKTSTFHEMVAGDNGRAAAAFLGTTTAGDAYADGFTGVWHLYVSVTYDGGATWTTQQVTSDPVQRGWICADGTSCSTGRNLLDFMDAQIDEKGRILVAYVDGCIDTCDTAEESTSAAPVITRQVSGNTLRAAFDGTLNVLRSRPGGPYSGAEDTAIALSGAASGGTGTYSFAWTVDSKPAGSAAGASSFSSTTSATPTFTPDVPGAYGLKLTVTDSASATASAIASLTATTTGGGTGGPLLEDEENDQSLNAIVVSVGGFPPGTDILGAEIPDETADAFTVELSIADLALATPAAVNAAGIPTGADTIYTVGFDYEESAGNVVRYQVASSQYALGVSGDATTFELQVLGVGATNFVTGVGAITGEWDFDANVIRWSVPKALMVVKTAPTSNVDPGVMTGGNVPAAGDLLENPHAEVRTWVFAGVGVGPSFTIWDTASGTGAYEFTG